MARRQSDPKPAKTAKAAKTPVAAHADGALGFNTPGSYAEFIRLSSIVEEPGLADTARSLLP